MEKKDFVEVIRRGLMSTGWIGQVIETKGDYATVLFPHREKPLKYNKMSLRKVDKPVKQAPKPIIKDEDRFEIKELRRLVIAGDGVVYTVVYVDDTGKQAARDCVIQAKHINDENQTLEIGMGNNIKYENIQFLFRRNSKARFKRPAENKFPFYVLDEDVVELQINGIKVNHRTGGYDTLKTSRYDMLVEWLEDANAIKPQFVVEQFRVLKEGMAFAPDEAFDLALQQQINASNQARKDKNCFGVVFRDIKTGVVKVESTFGRPCHARMNSICAEYDKKKWELVNAVQYYCGSLDRYEHSDEWLMYVMNESPWARYCITKTIEEAKESGIRVRTDIPSNAMMCTFYALRYPTEYSRKITAWKNYCDAGMNKTVAFFAAETGLLQRNTSGHHQLLDTYSMDLESLIKFGKCEVGGNIEEDYNKSRRYRNVSVHHGCPKLKDNHKDNGTAIEALHKMDIFGGGEVAGGAFGGGGGRQVSLEKAIEVTNNLLQV